MAERMALRLLDPGEANVPTPHFVAALGVSVEAVASILRTTPFEASVDGLGRVASIPTAIADTQLAAGLALFVAYRDAPSSALTHLLASSAIGDLTEVLEVTLGTLDLKLSDVVWTVPGVTPVSHEVWRQDEHGNRYRLGCFPCRAEAERYLRPFEPLAHKQSYWLEPAS